MSNDQAPVDLEYPTPSLPLATVIAFPSAMEHAAPLPEPLSSFIGRQQDVAQVAGAKAAQLTHIAAAGPGQ